MSKNKKNTIDLANGNFAHTKLEAELVATKFRLSEMQQVLEAIPECPLHGKNCVPHALDWIREAVNQTVINPHSKKSKIDNKPVTEKKSDVRYIAETYNIPMNIIRKIMRDKGKNGKYARNSNIIYAALCELGYAIQNN